MATTSATLRSASGLQGAWAFVIEGIPAAFTTWSSASQMATAWAGTDYNSVTWRTGLHIPGRITQRLALHDPQIEWDSLDIRVTDADDFIVGTICREAHSTANKTYLSSDLNNSANTASVDSTTGFAASGTIYVGNEAIDYSGKTATTFTGLTRGKYSLFTTNAGARFSDYHAIAVDESIYRPEVWDQPRTHYNRRCALYLHHLEDGTLVTKTNAKLVWAGRLKGAPHDNGDGSFSFKAWDIREQLNVTLLSDQYTAKLQEGMYLAAIYAKVTIESSKLTPGGASTERNTSETAIPFAVSPSTDRYRTHQEIRDGLNSQFNTWVSGSTIWPSDMTIVEDTSSGELRYKIVARMPDTTNLYNLTVRLTSYVWTMLGFEAEVIFGAAPTTKALDREGTSATYSLTAPNPPLVHQLFFGAASALSVTDVRGSWANQPAASLPPGSEDANGIVQLGDIGVFAVNRSGTTLTIKADLTAYLAPLGVPATPHYRVFVSGVPLQVRQVWVETGQVGTILLQLLASTGTSAYNHATYDVYGRGMGAGIPFSLINPWPWFFLSPANYWLVLFKPTPFLELLKSALQLRDAYLVWKDGQLVLTRPGMAPPGLADWTLTEANKANTGPDEPDRTTFERGAAGLVTRVLLEFDMGVDGTFRDKISVINPAAETDFGTTRGLTIKGYGVYRSMLSTAETGLNDYAATAAVLLSHYSRPVTLCKRSADFSLSEVAPGDTIAVTDNYLINSATGARGVTSWPGFVTESSFDWQAGRGMIEFAMFPEVNVDWLATWAPSAQVASSSVAGGKLTVTCEEGRYTTLYDADHFEVGDKCLIYEASPTNPAAPTTYAVTVDQAIDGSDQIRFTTDPVPGALPTNKTWLVTYDDIATVVAAQKAKAFIADDADTTTGDGTYTRYVWSAPPAPLTSSSINYTGRYRRLVNQADDKGEPLAVHWVYDACEGANCLYSYVTAPQYVNEQFGTNATQTGTTRKLAWGPVWLDLTGAGARTLKCRAYAKTSAGTGTIRVVASTHPVRGTADTSLTYVDAGVKFVEQTLTTTTFAYTAEFALTAPWRRAEPGSPGGCWITVEIYATAGDTITLAGFAIREANL